MQRDGFREIKPEEMTDNVFRLIGSDWMLITAGASEARGKWNTMTASWGGLGVLWNRPVCFCFVRPSRHTRGFMDGAGDFTLSFFDTERYRDALNYCGSHSGRDVDKARETGLTPVEEAGRMVWFAEARLVAQCRKIYSQDIEPGRFLDPAIQGNYPQQDYHRMYVGEILKVLVR